MGDEIYRRFKAYVRAKNRDPARVRVFLSADGSRVERIEFLNQKGEPDGELRLGAPQG